MSAPGRTQDIVIVGGGIVGLSLAASFSMHGIYVMEPNILRLEISLQSCDQRAQQNHADRGLGSV